MCSLEAPALSGLDTLGTLNLFKLSLGFFGSGPSCSWPEFVDPTDNLLLITLSVPTVVYPFPLVYLELSADSSSYLYLIETISPTSQLAPLECFNLSTVLLLLPM